MPLEPPPDGTTRATLLIEEFRALPATSDRRREIVAELDDDCGNPEVTAFLTTVVADPGEYDLARIEATTLLRLWPPPDPATRRTAGRALLTALHDPEEDLVRQYAAMALGPYADDPAVHEALTTVADTDDDPLMGAAARAALAERDRRT
ncbi:hypothetical protein [Streptomyces sp. ML-6]|uniref:hypothetical protein n=1 Tax=Streptomyces sp. ML-6 TaxID=2982693 RepID=UPI0024C05AFF|nr:hypothetical protein [Streptomyces sp. ML-6]MDK0520211.1 hypothetical protein [Streptomyces sp. ML-6]